MKNSKILFLSVPTSMKSVPGLSPNHNKQLVFAVECVMKGEQGKADNKNNFCVQRRRTSTRGKWKSRKKRRAKKINFTSQTCRRLRRDEGKKAKNQKE